jgi:hypothetical protein
MDHIRPDRLLEVADKNARFSEVEFQHIEKCSECVGALAKLILQNARPRARKKTTRLRRDAGKNRV